MVKGGERFHPNRHWRKQRTDRRLQIKEDLKKAASDADDFFRTAAEEGSGNSLPLFYSRSLQAQL
jgi:hypothetical protein